MSNKEDQDVLENENNPSAVPSAETGNIKLSVAPSSLRIDLSPTPIDGFEVRYFTIRGECIQEIRLRYHANSKWSDVSSSKGGAPLIDQWQVFQGGYFSGRMEGWRTPATLDHGLDFEARNEAVNALRRIFEQRAEWADKEASRYREKARQLTNTAASAGTA